MPNPTGNRLFGQPAGIVSGQTDNNIFCSFVFRVALRPVFGSTGRNWQLAKSAGAPVVQRMGPGVSDGNCPSLNAFRVSKKEWPSFLLCFRYGIFKSKKTYRLPGRPTAWFYRCVRGGLRNQCCCLKDFKGSDRRCGVIFREELDEQTNIVGGFAETNLLSKKSFIRRKATREEGAGIVAKHWQLPS
ncbi:hypothetical protein [Flavisolibacter nicotianae]|uniref:hypothetical protein n=1 Tax=Flavisolibacter nicotianae TaxID=2364882 RepID=UPI0013C537FC|nr:hypothetical protein [Flavisolibacter nicotianae]